MIRTAREPLHRLVCAPRLEPADAGLAEQPPEDVVALAMNGELNMAKSIS